MARRRYQKPRVRKCGKRQVRWKIVCRRDATGGARVQEWVDLAPAKGPKAISKREAERLRDEYIEQVNRLNCAVQSRIPFGEFLDIYTRQHVPTLRPPSQQQYVRQIEKHIRPALGKLPLKDVTPERVDVWLLEKQREGLGYAARLGLRNLLSGVFTCAHKWGYWKERNPAEHANIGRLSAVYEKRKLGDEAIARLLATVSLEVRWIILMGLIYGLRVSETMGLEERHLDFEQGMIQIRQRLSRNDLGDPKTLGSSRDIPMGGLAEDLRALCVGEPGRRLFQVRGARGGWLDDRQILERHLRPAAKALGIHYPGFGWRAFRREAKTALGQAMDPFQVMRMFGHRQADVSLLYTLTDRKQQEQAIRARQEKFVN